MPKRKHEAPASQQLELVQHQQQSNHHHYSEIMNQELEFKKRTSSTAAAARAPPSLNFSIESIMNNTAHQQQETYNNQTRPDIATTTSDYNHTVSSMPITHSSNKAKRRRVDNGRSIGKRSPSPSAVANDEDHDDDDDDDEICSQRTSLSGASRSNLICGVNSSVSSTRSSSNSSRSSRVSTPISPGCNSINPVDDDDEDEGDNNSDNDEMNRLGGYSSRQQQQQQQHLLDSNRLCKVATNPALNSSQGNQQHHHHHNQHNHHSNNNSTHHHQQQQQRSSKQKHHQHHQQHHNHHNHNQQHQTTAATAGAANSNPTRAPSTNPNSNARLEQVECVLDNKDMWDKFHSLNTEMIITKTGRRMFPVMKVQFHNLDPTARYAVSMDIVPVDNKRYRYAYHKSCWQVAGKADPSAEPRLYAHPDSPFNGDLLSRQVISFEKVKLTNNEADKTGHIILNSMHKYQPRVHLIELKQTMQASSTAATATMNSGKSTTSSSSDYNNQYNNNNNNHRQYNNNGKQQQAQPQLDIEGYRTFVFPETVFTAVTAYQNQLITKMKIDKNPFAKGFRDSSRLSDLDRGDPFDYMSGPLGSLGPPGSGRFPGMPPTCTTPGGSPAQPGSLDAAMAAIAAATAAASAPPGGLAGSNPMDAYQLLANNPWYSAAAMAAAAGQAAAASANPFNPAAAACSTAQAAQQLQTQMWLATLSACLGSGGGNVNGNGCTPPTSTMPNGTGPPPIGGSQFGGPNGLQMHPSFAPQSQPQQQMRASSGMQLQSPPGGASPSSLASEKLTSSAAEAARAGSTHH